MVSWEYYEKLPKNQITQLKWTNEMDKFLERHKVARLTQEEIENLKRPMTKRLKE